jgi:hypothetical protein
MTGSSAVTTPSMVQFKPEKIASSTATLAPIQTSKVGVGGVRDVPRFGQ